MHRLGDGDGGRGDGGVGGLGAQDLVPRRRLPSAGCLPHDLGLGGIDEVREAFATDARDLEVVRRPLGYERAPYGPFESCPLCSDKRGCAHVELLPA